MLIRVSYCIITGVPNTYCGHPKSTADETTKNRDAVGSGFEHKMSEKNQGDVRAPGGKQDSNLASVTRTSKEDGKRSARANAAVVRRMSNNCNSVVDSFGIIDQPEESQNSQQNRSKRMTEKKKHRPSPRRDTLPPLTNDSKHNVATAPEVGRAVKRRVTWTQDVEILHFDKFRPPSSISRRESQNGSLGNASALCATISVGSGGITNGKDRHFASTPRSGSFTDVPVVQRKDSDVLSDRVLQSLAEQTRAVFKRCEELQAKITSADAERETLRNELSDLYDGLGDNKITAAVNRLDAAQSRYSAMIAREANMRSDIHKLRSRRDEWHVALGAARLDAISLDTISQANRADAHEVVEECRRLLKQAVLREQTIPAR